MDPAGLELERREQAIEFGNRPPADRASAPPSASRPTKVIDEIRRHDDGSRRRRDVDERAVDVEEQAGVVRRWFGSHPGCSQCKMRPSRCHADVPSSGRNVNEESKFPSSGQASAGAMVQCGTMLSTVAFRVDDDSRSPAPSASMRIAQIAPLMESVPPRLYGGTERIVSWLTEELVRQGHDVTLFASGDSMTASKLYRAPRRRSDCRKR